MPRSEFGPSPEGRRVQPVTGSLRDKYLKIFRDWVTSEGIDLDSVLQNFRTVMSGLKRSTYSFVVLGDSFLKRARRIINTPRPSTAELRYAHRSAGRCRVRGILGMRG